MANTNYKNKSQPVQNRGLIILFVVIGAVLVLLYCYKWHQVRNEEKYLTSYLVSTNTISLEMNEIDEIDSVLLETPSYYFVYISYTKDESVYNLEKKLKPLIDEYDLQNNFYYINVTDIKENNKNYKADIAKKLNVDSSKINEVPVILYFKDSKLVKDSITNAKDFEKLLKDEQDIEAK